MQKQFIKFDSFTEQIKTENQGKFKIHLWAHQRDGYRMMGEAFQ